jgi:hypothetical protein
MMEHIRESVCGETAFNPANLAMDLWWESTKGPTQEQSKGLWTIDKTCKML